MSFLSALALALLSSGFRTVTASGSDASSDSGNDVSLDDGLRTLLEAVCIIMTIIVLGYLARISGYILPDAEKGIGAIAGRVALPALLASSVASADIPAFLKEGGLKVVAVDFACKFVLILIAMAMALCRRSDAPRLSTMGAYGFFVTNSNYMAVGVPLVSAIFGKEKILYLIFFAMVQNIVITPILLAIMLCGLAKREVGKDGECHESRLQVLKQSVLRVASDPIVMAAVIGLVYNLSTLNSSVKMNGVLKGVTQQLGNAFSLCALFNLGMGIVGHVQSMASRSVIVPLLLIMLKSLALPMLEKAVGEIFLSQDQTDMLWVAGCISTAASTALITSSFVPSLGAIFRGATVLNLIMSLPLLLLSQTLFKSSAETRGEITNYGRIFGNILSMVGLVVLMLNFSAVKRWQRYPMWLIFDLALMGLPFYVGHYICHIVREVAPTPMLAFHVLYFVTNVSRLARQAYMLALCFILLAQVRWHRWFPDTPYGYVETARRAPAADEELDAKAPAAETPVGEAAVVAEGSSATCGYHDKMRKMHWAARIFAVFAGLAGTIPFMAFVPLQPLSGFSCWCAYGVPQWTWEMVSFTIATSLQGAVLLSYLVVKSKPDWQHDRTKMFPGVKFGLATLLILQFINLVMCTLLTVQIVMIGQENFQVDPVWLQPLVVLILLTDGGGFLHMFIFETSDVTWATYRKLCYGMWVRLVGRTQVRNLKAYALMMATDPKLLDTYRSGEKHFRKASAFSGCDAVDWMLEHGDCMTRKEAKGLCLQMMSRNLLVPSADQPLVTFLDATDYTYIINQPRFRPKYFKAADEAPQTDAEAVAWSQRDKDDDEYEEEDADQELGTTTV